MMRPTFAEIHLNHLRHNYRQLRALTDSDFFCPMVKSNAYGHGDVAVGQALAEEGADRLGVAFLPEGVKLRQEGIDSAEILTFASFQGEGAEAVASYRLTPVLSTWEQIRALERSLSKTARHPVHIKFNTGMYRLGFAPAEANELANYFRDQSRFHLEGLCTHLAGAEDSYLRDGKSQQQLDLFRSVTSQFAFASSLALHTLNSAGLLGFSLRGKNWDSKWGSRPGIALYGFKPNLKALDEEAKMRWREVSLKPVMRLRSELVKVHTIQPGEKVSYGGRWSAQEPGLIGVVPIGYGDGYPRILSNQAEMLFRGKRVPVVGTVCMDYTMIDLTHVVKEGGAQVGEELILFDSGDEARLRADEVAKLAQTISYEILTSVGQRVERRYVEGDRV